MELQQVFSQAEEIVVYTDGEVSVYPVDGDGFRQILAEWSALLDGSVTMPAFGVSINDYTLGAMKSGKWVWGGIGLQLATGYTVAYLVYTIGTIVTGGTLNIGAAIGGLIAVAAMVAVVVGLIMNTNKKLKAEYALSGAKN